MSNGPCAAPQIFAMASRACRFPGSSPKMSIPGFSFPHKHLSGHRGPQPARNSPSARSRRGGGRHFAPGREEEARRLRGRTQINLFFEASTRTQSSFETRRQAAGRRRDEHVGGATRRVKKGETLIDTAMTLNAMRPDIIVVRHHQAGAAHLLARKVDCSVVNAGDGAHEHPTQALLDALTIRRNQGPHRGADGRDLRRHPAFARRALQHPAARRARRARARRRPLDPAAAGHRAHGRRGLHAT